MKKLLKSCPILLFLLSVPSLLLAQDYPPLSLTLDLAGLDASAGDQSSFGAGGQFWVDYRFAPLLSIGTGLSAMNYSGFSTASWDLGGRLWFLGQGTGGDFYFQGGLGLNLSTATLKKTWPGKYNGTASLGYAVNCLGPNLGLDLGLVYDLNNPISNPLQAIGAKAGLVLYLGGSAPAPKPSATPQPAAVSPIPVHRAVKKPLTPNPVLSSSKGSKLRAPNPSNKVAPAPLASPTPNPSAPQTYAWAKGDNLTSVAVAFYGEENLFPLLVDANKDKVLSPGDLKPGVELLIPQGVSEAEKVSARLKADSPEYDAWKKWGTTKSSWF